MQSSPSPYAVTVDDLCKRYPKSSVPALQKLGLLVEKGEVFGLLGPNGAGKTTLISILCTLLQSDSGTGQVWGYDLRREAAKIRSCIGLVPQDLALYPSLTPIENLEYFGRLQKIGKQLRQRIDSCLARVGLSQQSNQPVAHFSGGMKRRLNLAAGILHEPQVLFLDEPTVGVDPQSRALIFELVKQLREKGMTVIYTTHYMEEAEQLCDRVAIMDCGRIIAQDSPQNLIAGRPGCTNLEDFFMQLTGKQLRDG